MLYFKLKENSPQARQLAEYLKTLNYIEIITDPTQEKLLEQIKEGLKDVKRMQDGKAKKRTLKDLLNG